MPADCAPLTALVHTSTAYAGDFRSAVSQVFVTPAQIERDSVFAAVVPGVHRGGVLGFYALADRGPAPDDLPCAGAPFGELDLLFVADAAQGSGVGRRLFDHMRERARAKGLRGVQIVSHPPAELFYAKMGATRIGTMPSQRHAAWERPRMWLALDGSVPTPSMPGEPIQLQERERAMAQFIEGQRP